MKMKKLEEDMNNWNGDFPPKTFADGTCLLIGTLGNVGVVDTVDGLVVFDIGGNGQERYIYRELRKFSKKPVKYIIYSHGHFDHAFGYAPIIKEIKRKGWGMPEVIAHENLPRRFEKYRILDKYHTWLNLRQMAPKIADKVGDRLLVSAHETLDPTIILRGNESSYKFKLGQYTFEIYHDKGETDDSLWMWLPEKKVLFSGELVSNPTFPNAGNPNKVQRYPKQWAIAMDKMIEKNADYLLPGHGQLVEGKDDVREIISIRAEVMHFIHDEVVKRMNEGKYFEQIYHELLEIRPEKFKNHRFLSDSYGDYRFVIHCAYRLYHGWYNTGNPTDLFPAKSVDIANEFITLIDESEFVNRANKLFDEGKIQLALHLLDVVIKSSEVKSEDTLLNAYILKEKILSQMAEEEVNHMARNAYIYGTIQMRKKIEQLKTKSN
jgi:alkyl sulfatase BDS1-like metallo-beta-lactamase superfamily hydrolase